MAGGGKVLCVVTLRGGGPGGLLFFYVACIKTWAACFTLSLTYDRALCGMVTVFSGLAGGQGVVGGRSVHESSSFVGVLNFGG